MQRLTASGLLPLSIAMSISICSSNGIVFHNSSSLTFFCSCGAIKLFFGRADTRFADVINLSGKIQSPQRHAEQEPQPGHDAVAIADARDAAAIGSCR